MAPLLSSVQQQIYILSISLSCGIIVCIILIVYISYNINWITENIRQQSRLRQLHRQVSFAFKSQEQLNKNTSRQESPKEVHKR